MKDGKKKIPHAVTKNAYTGGLAPGEEIKIVTNRARREKKIGYSVRRGESHHLIVIEPVWGLIWGKRGSERYRTDKKANVKKA